MPARDPIFISYRRSDSEGYAGRLEDTLKAYFGRERVIRDIGGIVPGQDFKQKSEEIAARAAALIVLIGPHWLERAEGGRPRLHEPGDLVATEIRAALEKGHVIVPVLVQGANMPREDELPEGLKALSRRNAVSISDADWATDTTRLAKVLAIDVRSAHERQIEWLKLAVVLMLVVPFVISLFLIANPEFRGKAIRSGADYRTFVFKLTDQSLARLKPELRQWLEARRSALEAVEDRSGKDQLRAALEGGAGLAPADVDAVLACCTWSVGERKKTETQAVSTMNAVAILLVSLLLGATRAWVDPASRRFVWAAIVTGFAGVAGAFFYYLRNIDESPYIWPSDEYFGMLATSIIIGVMLGLLVLSGFKANASVQ